MSENPDFELLVQYIAGELTKDRSAQVDQLVRTAPSWATAHRLLQKLVVVGRELDQSTAESMRELAERLYSDFRRREAHGQESLGIRVFDSQVLPIPEGVRPASVDTRRLRYRLDDVQLELSLYPLTPESYELIGQLEGIGQAGTVTVRLEQGKRRKSVQADQFHLFRFDRVPAGACRLVIESDSTVIGYIYLDL